MQIMIQLAKFMNKKTLAIFICVFLVSSCSGYKQDRFENLPPISPAKISEPSNSSPKIFKKKVKIAALLPLSGKNKDLGIALLNSITISIFENDQNHDIEIVVFDSEDIKKSAKQITAQNITTVIGPVFTSNVKAFVRATKKEEITILSLSNNQDLIDIPNVFLMGFLPEQQIERIVGYSILLQKDQFAIIAPRNQYGRKLSEIMEQMVYRKDGIMITSQLYANSNKDLERVVSKAISSFVVAPEIENNKETADEDKFYANTILIPESGASLAKIVKLIKKYNNSERDIQIIGTSNWDDVKTLEYPDLMGGWFTSADPKEYLSFKKRYQKTYDKLPPRISTIAYDATLAVIVALNKSEKRKLTADDFVNYESQRNGFMGIDGLFRFLPNGIVQRNFAILKIENSEFAMIDSPNWFLFAY
ncbi:MAG: ABC-type branched-subunit amino acid transport system substrate-binding protein [Rickettsiales bacterium]|jgi:ABC-type branched-subunit amino acid transport system substrate-binding protein